MITSAWGRSYEAVYILHASSILLRFVLLKLDFVYAQFQVVFPTRSGWKLYCTMCLYIVSYGGNS